MNEQQAGTGSQRRSRAEVDQLVAEYETGELSKQEFCRRHGLTLATLNRYRRRRQRNPLPKARKNRWVAVEVSAPPQEGHSVNGALTVVLANGRRIEVPRGFEASLLRQLVQVLEQS